MVFHHVGDRGVAQHRGAQLANHPVAAGDFLGEIQRLRCGQQGVCRRVGQPAHGGY